MGRWARRTPVAPDVHGHRGIVEAGIGIAAAGVGIVAAVETVAAVAVGKAGTDGTIGELPPPE